MKPSKLKIYSITSTWSLILLLLVISINTTNAQVPSWEWANSVNTGGKELAQDVLVDPANNVVYLVGQWKDDISAFFPSGANPGTDFTSTYGGDDGFVAKYDTDGNFIWAFKVGGTDNDAVNSIAIDTIGNIYITGFIEKGICQFSGTSPVTGSSSFLNIDKDDFFIAKYNSDGEFLWIRRSITSIEDNTGLDVYTTSSGVYATGTFKSNCAFGSLSITETFGGEDMFLIKYNSDGDEQWLIYGGSDKSDFAFGITADESNVYITGAFKGELMEFKTTSGTTASTLTNTHDGKEEGFLVSYDAAGTFNWSSQIASSEEVESFDITMDSDSLYITGGMEGPVNFQLYAGNPVVTTNNRDIFFSSHSKINGNTGWVQTIPCTDGGSEYGRAITINEYGDLFITGYFKENLQFPDAVTLSSAGAEDVFVASYSNNGIFKWALNPESSGSEYGYGISAGPDGSIYFGGSYDKQMYFDLLSIPDDGGENAFVAKLQEPCTNAIGGTASSTETEICIGQSATLSLTGHSGQIIWQSSPSGMDIWSDIPGETTASVTVSPIINTDYRAYLTFGSCNPDSSNIILITITPSPTIADAGPDQTDDLMCGVTSTTLAANTPIIGTGLWSIVSGNGGTVETPASPTSNFNGIAGETYVLRWTITNALCTPSTDEVSITFIQEPSIADAGPDQIDDLTCGVTSTTLAANTPIIGTGLWSIVSGNGGTVETPASPTSNFNGIAGETYVLRWTITNAPCTPSTDELSITFIQEPTIADAGPDQIGSLMCGITSTSLAANTPIIGTGLWSIVSGNGGTVETPASPTSNFNGIAGETYVLRWTITNAPCTPSTDELSITFIQEPTIADAGPVQIGSSMCGITSTTLSANTPVAGTGSWSIVSGNGGTVETSVSPISGFNGIAGETYVLRWTITNGVCTSSTSDVTITFYQEPVSNAGNGGFECDLDFQLMATPGIGSGTWTMTSGTGLASFSPNANDPSAVVSVSESGIKEFTWTEINGTCSDASSITVDFLQEITVNAGMGGEECGLNIELKAEISFGSGIWIKKSGPGDVSFSPTENDPGALVTVSEYGTYEFTWTESNESCSGSATVSVIFWEQPTAYAGPDQTLDFQLETSLEADLPLVGHGIWDVTNSTATILDLNDPKSSVSGLTPGENIYTWKVRNGVCIEATDEVVIFVNEMEPPTVFTPNSDGLNDELVFPGLSAYEGSSIIIYNRWGNEVYRSNNYKNDWTGKNQKQNDLQKDTYFYVLKISNGQIVKGFIEIKR